MIFAAPWLLLALAALPLLWWLLRVTPPSPVTQNFPAIRLLAGLRSAEETPARTPWWLLLLRMAAAALIIVGLARPILDAAAGPPGAGPLLLVVFHQVGTPGHQQPSIARRADRSKHLGRVRSQGKSGKVRGLLSPGAPPNRAIPAYAATANAS